MVKYGRLDSTNYSERFKKVFDDITYLEEAYEKYPKHWSTEKKYDVFHVLARRVRDFHAMFDKAFSKTITSAPKKSTVGENSYNIPHQAPIDTTKYKFLLCPEKLTAMSEKELNTYRQKLSQIFTDMNKNEYELENFYEVMENPHSKYVMDSLLNRFNPNFFKDMADAAERAAKSTIGNAVSGYQNALKKLEDKELDLETRREITSKMDLKTIAYEEAGKLQKELDSFVNRKKLSRTI